MKRYKNGDEFRANLKDGEITALFYMTGCPFCRDFCPKFEKKFEGKGNCVIVAIDTDEDNAWDEYGIRAVPTVLVFKKKKIAKRHDAVPGLGLRIEEIK